jgi:hypothetical protein
MSYARLKGLGFVDTKRNGESALRFHQFADSS